jgi:hypothetical protein
MLSSIPGRSAGKENAFVIKGPGRFLNLCADDEDERDRWIHGLTVRIEAHKEHLKAVPVPVVWAQIQVNPEEAVALRGVAMVAMKGAYGRELTYL